MSKNSARIFIRLFIYLFLFIYLSIHGELREAADINIKKVALYDIMKLYDEDSMVAPIFLQRPPSQFPRTPIQPPKYGPIYYQTLPGRFPVRMGNSILYAPDANQSMPGLLKRKRKKKARQGME